MHKHVHKYTFKHPSPSVNKMQNHSLPDSLFCLCRMMLLNNELDIMAPFLAEISHVVGEA